MKSITNYLFFDGNCREAMTFYAKCMGAEPHMMTYAEGPGGGPPEHKDRIMHARVAKGPAVLMASDIMPGGPFQQGSNFSVCVDCESLEEIEALFKAVGDKGTVNTALQDMFWGARFGMLKDQFGIHWMFTYELPKKG